MKILLDTSLLLDCAKYRVDFSAQLHGHELLTLSSCFNELEKLSARKGRTGEAARIALVMVLAKGVRIVRSAEKNTDAAILSYALREKCCVATNDRALIKSLKKNGIRIIRLREKKKLIEE